MSGAEGRGQGRRGGGPLDLSHPGHVYNSVLSLSNQEAQGQH